MAGSRSIIEPITMFPTFTETAVPLEGLDVPLNAFAHRTRSVNEPIVPQPAHQVLAVPLGGRPAPAGGELGSAVRSHLEAAGAHDLSAAELAVLRAWMDGRSETDSAAELSWTVAAVREARGGLLRRLRITFDPSPS